MACNEQKKEISEHNNENYIQKKSHDRQTSAELNLPNETAHNMNDLKLFDFNSADEVRQRMKEVRAENGPNFEENAEDFIGIDVGDEKLQKNNLHLHLMSKLTGTEDLKLYDKRMTEIIQPMTSLSANNNTGTSRKRAGRPPKAGPSKKLKKPQISTFYWGKLSNVVFWKRKREINS